jgi:hypothetical protein
MAISSLNKRTLNVLLFSSAGLFTLEIFLAKFGYIAIHNDNRLVLTLFVLPPLLATICFFIVFYNRWFKDKQTGLLALLMRGLFCILAVFMIAILAVLIIKFSS